MNSSNNRNNPQTTASFQGEANVSQSTESSSQAPAASSVQYSTSFDVVSETVNLVEKLQRLPQDESTNLLEDADRTVQLLIDALNSGDIEVAEEILDTNIILTKNSLDRVESLMIALLQRGYLEFGWSTCAFLLNLQTEKQAVYLQEFFLYFEKIQKITKENEISNNLAIDEIQGALKSFVEFYSTAKATPRIPNIFTSVLEIAIFFKDLKSAAILFRRGVLAREQKIAFVYAKLLTDIGEDKLAESISDIPLSLEQSTYFAQFMLSRELRMGDGTKIEKLRQKLVGIYALEERIVPQFPFFSQLGYQSGTETLFQLQEEISGKILNPEEQGEIWLGIHKNFPQNSLSLSKFISEPFFLSAEEQRALHEELLLIQFAALELCSLEAMEKYIDIIDGLLKTPIGENLLYMFFLKFPSPSVFRSLTVQLDVSAKGEDIINVYGNPDREQTSDSVIEPKFSQGATDLSLPHYLFSHCLFVAGMLHKKTDIELLKKILILLKKNGDQETIQIDGDIPEFEKIEKKIEGLMGFSESLSHFSIEGQQYFAALEKKILSKQNEYALGKCVTAVQSSLPLDDSFSDELIVYICVRALFSGETSSHFLRCIEKIDINTVEGNLLALLGQTIIHFNTIFSHYPQAVCSMLLYWYFDSQGSTESILSIFEYFVRINDSNSLKIKAEMEEFMKKFLDEAIEGTEINEVICNSSEGFAKIMMDGFPSVERKKDDIDRILARAKYLDDDFIGAFEQLQGLREFTPIDRLFILKIQAAVNGYTWTGKNELKSEWENTRSISSFRDICRMYASNSQWKEFDMLVSEGYQQNIPFVIEAYFIALDEILHRTNDEDGANMVYSLLHRMYQYPVEQSILLPQHVKNKVHAWAYQASNGEFENFHPNNGQLLFIYSILCKEKVSGYVPTEKSVNIYWSLIEKALISRTRSDIEMLVLHYERKYFGHITTDGQKSETVNELFQPVREDVEEFFTLLESEEYGFSKVFIAQWIRRIALIVSDVFQESEYVDSLLDRAEIYLLGNSQDIPSYVTSYGSRFLH